jgi:transcription antitermination factor NusG
VTNKKLGYAMQQELDAGEAEAIALALEVAAELLLEVDEAIIAALRQRSANGYLEIPLVPFFPGEELEIISGSFQGLRALFQQELKAGERVAVLLELLSSRVRVELPRAYVETKSRAEIESLVA